MFSGPPRRRPQRPPTGPEKVLSDADVDQLTRRKNEKNKQSETDREQEEGEESEVPEESAPIEEEKTEAPYEEVVQTEVLKGQDDQAPVAESPNVVDTEGEASQEGGEGQSADKI